MNKEQILDKINLSVAGILEWFKTLPLDKKFNYQSMDDCMLAQYIKSKGFDCIIGNNYYSIYYSGDHCFDLDLPQSILDKMIKLREIHFFTVEQAIEEFSK